MPGPLLAEATNDSPTQVTTWQAASISPPGDDILLVGVVGFGGLDMDARVLTDATGFTRDVTAGVDDVLAWFGLALAHRSIASAAPPYAPTWGCDAAVYWGLGNLAFRATGAQPSNSGSASGSYACTTNPSLTALLGSLPTAGNVLVAAFWVGTCGGPYTGSQEIVWPAGWTALGATPGSFGFGRIAYAYKVADGTEDGIHGVYFDSNNTSANMLLVAEYAVDPTPPPVDCGPFMFDVYAPGVGSSSALSYLDTLCSARRKAVTIEELGAGAGSFVINRHSDEATVATLGEGTDDARLVKVRVPAISPSPIAAFWIEQGNYTVLSENEEGGEDLSFGGRGALAYLDRAKMAPRSYLTDPVLVQPHDRLWKFERPDLAGALAFLQSAGNGTGSLTGTWQLPTVGPDGDDVLLVAFLQQRPPSAITPPAGWTNRVAQDTSLGGGSEIRYQMADRVVATGAPPYADTFASADPARWTAAQLAFRSTGAPTGVDGSAHQAESTPEGTITASLSGTPTAGNILIAYASETTVTDTGEHSNTTYEWPAGWTQILRIPNANTYTGVAAVAYKVADGTETDVTVIVRDDVDLTSTSLLVAEYPILYSPLKAGEILYLVCAELLAAGRPVNPVPILSLDFTFELDSNGDPWEETPGTAGFTAQVGESVLEIVLRLLATGSIVVVMDPDLVLHAYNRSTYGRDLTGPSFASDVVRFVAGVSIAERLSKRRNIPTAGTHAWASGDEDTYAVRAAPDATSRVRREVAVAARTTDGAALVGMADSELAFREEQAERIRLPTVVGTTPLTGRYIPGAAGTSGHYWPGDTVRVHTGTGDFDYDEADERVAIVSIAEPPEDEAAIVEVTDLDITAQLISNMTPGSAPASIGATGSGSAGVLPGSTSDHGELTGLLDDDHPQYLPRSEYVTASDVEPFDHSDMGATETLDYEVRSWHRGNLNVACAITVQGFTADLGQIMVVELTGTGAITWDADVDFGGADDQPDASGFTIFILVSSVGSTDVKGSKFGGGGTGTPASAAAIAALGFVGPIVVVDSPSTPLVFADLVQNEDQDDLVYADL